ncbi:hypothetical protein [Caudoviricetes sp.]|nr:hypothetical protein [Caudoviricetes sp.]
MGFETDAKRGVLNHYGVRTTNQKFGGAADDDIIKTVQWTFSYNDLPAGATSNLGYSIPANSTILSAKLQIIDAFTSTSTTTDLNAGLEQADGTDISVSGFITAAQATQTAIAVVNSVIDGASGTPAALIGTTIGTAAGELVVQSSAADLLTGKARLIVQYINRGL